MLATEQHESVRIFGICCLLSLVYAIVGKVRRGSRPSCKHNCLYILGDSVPVKPPEATCRRVRLGGPC